jgi:hypothetical protein
VPDGATEATGLRAAVTIADGIIAIVTKRISSIFSASMTSLPTAFGIWAGFSYAVAVYSVTAPLDSLTSEPLFGELRLLSLF